MNKFRILLPAVFLMAIAIVFSSCSDNDDIEDRLDKIEDAIGSNSPIKVDFNTTNYDDEAITNKTSYLFKAAYPNYDGMWPYDDETYYIAVERFSDVEWYEGAWFNFRYNPETKEVINPNAGTYFYDSYGSDRNARFYDDTANNTINIEVLSFDAETGKISLKITASSTEGYSYNIYEGKPMTMSLTFNAKIGVYEAGGNGD